MQCPKTKFLFVILGMLLSTVNLKMLMSPMIFFQHAIPPDNIREGRSNGDLYFNVGLGYESLGNTEEAVRNFSLAYEEYKFEKNNLEMEAECLEKIGNVYLKKKNIFALDTFSKLADVYHLMGKPVKQVEALAQKAAQMHANGKVEEAETTADECLKISKDCGSSQEIGNFYELKLEFFIVTNLPIFVLRWNLLKKNTFCFFAIIKNNFFQL